MQGTAGEQGWAGEAAALQVSWWILLDEMPLAAEEAIHWLTWSHHFLYYPQKYPAMGMGISQTISEKRGIRAQYWEWKVSSLALKEGPANQSHCSFEKSMLSPRQ